LPDSPADDLDGLIRRVDPDRWLTSRFIADRQARADVVALYAFDYELWRARRMATSPLMAEIRLAWWREALDEIFAGAPVRAHPTAMALAAAVGRRRLARAPFDSMVDGAVEALELAELDEAASERWASAVEGALASTAAQMLDPTSPAGAAAPSGRAWGLALLWRAGLARPATLVTPLQRAIDEARVLARSLSPVALPAALPARLARYDLARRSPGPLVKRLTLLAAVASGRI
jgi:phytoene synthase